VRSLLLLLAAACTPSPAPQAVPVRDVAPYPAGNINLMHDLTDAQLDLPASSRTAPVPEWFRPLGEVTRQKADAGYVVWAIPLPYHSSLFPSPRNGARSFGNWEPEGLEILFRGEPLTFLRDGKGPMRFGFNRKSLLVGLPETKGKPEASDFTLRWPKAADKERSLQLDQAGMSPADFAVREISIGKGAHRGLLLPAPATYRRTLTVPANGRFGARATVLPPALLDGPPSDGAQLTVSVVVQGATTELATLDVAVDTWQNTSVDLSAYAGQDIELVLQTSGGESTERDLVFLQEPAVYQAKEAPKRVVMLYLDTLRRDHLGMYGYERPTTPRLDAWAEGAMILDNQRTIAPWTLPSARAALSGMQPEAWYDVPTLPQVLSEAGFVTSGLVANAYLSQTFDMNRGFGHYQYEHLLPAEAVLDHGREVLEAHPDRDVFLYLQFMEAHLPYMEPKRYRSLFTGPKPAELKSVSRVELVKWDPTRDGFEKVNRYVQARYDQNIRVMDDAIAAFLAELPDDATVVIYSDHGEEFWDHGTFEHGHTFFDELLRVPTILKDPALPAGRSDTYTSLMDLTPTLIELAGLPALKTQGDSLVTALRGNAAAQARLDERPLAIGRPLYGADGWGVIANKQKWWSRGGAQSVFDLTSDPMERQDIAATADRSGFPNAMSSSLGRAVQHVWRLHLRSFVAAQDLTLTVSHPDGIQQAWKAFDPRATYVGATPSVTDGTLTVSVPKGQRVPSTLFVLPAGDALRPEGLVVTVNGPQQVEVKGVTTPLTGAPTPEQVLTPDRSRWKIGADLAWAPLPGGTEVSAFHEDMKAQLQELGYVE